MLPSPEVRGRWRRLSSTGRSLALSSIIDTNGPPASGRLSDRTKVGLRSSCACTPAPTGALHCARRRRVLSSRTHLLERFPMQIEERTVGDVVVLDLKGKITLGEGDELLKDKVNSLVNQGHKKIVLNLADVPYIDSAGLGEIVRTYTTVSRQGGSLKLLNLTKRITDLLSITKLLTVFETFDSEKDAVGSFSAAKV